MAPLWPRFSPCACSVRNDRNPSPQPPPPVETIAVVLSPARKKAGGLAREARGAARPRAASALMSRWDFMVSKQASSGTKNRQSSSTIAVKSQVSWEGIFNWTQPSPAWQLQQTAINP